MIIECIKCNKKFDVDADLIPDNGRLLECSSCNHKWFFRKSIIEKTSISKNNTNNEINNTKPSTNTKKPSLQNKIPTENIDLLHQNVREDPLINKIDINKAIISNKTAKTYSIINLSLVFIISFIALIIILDTFKSPIGKIVPNIEFFLYNLYESIKDIKLFFKDLT
mgnify:FL=1|jgi:predicted Zn finger-like uncharacterized protein